MVSDVRSSLRLMLVTDDRLLAGRDPVAVCRAAVAGGVTSVQLRLKHASPRELVAVLRSLRTAVPVPLLVNDRLDVALAGPADGVHLGSDDIPVALARKVAPPGFIIGTSVGTDEEAARGTGADYWGVGPLRRTGTKTDAGEALGLAGFRHLVETAQGIPCVAIGGVRPEDVEPVRKAGGAGVAVAGGILGAPDLQSAAGEYRSIG